jgi:hypothetical protein
MHAARFNQTKWPIYYQKSKLTTIDKNFAKIRLKVTDNISADAQWALYGFLQKAAADYTGSVNKEVPSNLALKHATLLFLYYLLENPTNKQIQDQFGVSTSGWTRIVVWILTRVCIGNISLAALL